MKLFLLHCTSQIKCNSEWNELFSRRKQKKNFFQWLGRKFLSMFYRQTFFSLSLCVQQPPPPLSMSTFCVNFNTFLLPYFISHYHCSLFFSSPSSAWSAKVCYLVLNMRWNIMLDRSYVPRRLLPPAILHQHRRLF